MRGFIATAMPSSLCNYRLWGAQAATQHQPQGGPPPLSSGTAKRFKYREIKAWGGYYLYAGLHSHGQGELALQL